MDSGIYAIVNIENGKVYIGSTVNFEARWKDHQSYLYRGAHCNKHLQRSWSKYGGDAFEFSILEHVNDANNLCAVEQFWMDLYREEGKELYNFGLVADSPWRGCKHTKESKRKMSVSRMGHPSYGGMSGKKHSKETRCKMSKSAMGNQNALGHQNALGSKRSEEQKQKMSGATMGNKNSLGRVVSDKTRRKLSEAAKAQWARIRAQNIT